MSDERGKSMTESRDVVDVTFTVGERAKAWDTFDAQVTVMVTPRQAAEMIRDLLVVLERGVDDEEWSGGIRLEGAVYMTGRLPKEAVFTSAGVPVPDAVIIDECNDWDFDFLPGETEEEHQRRIAVANGEEP